MLPITIQLFAIGVECLFFDGCLRTQQNYLVYLSLHSNGLFWSHNWFSSPQLTSAHLGILQSSNQYIRILCYLCTESNVHPLCTVISLSFFRLPFVSFVTNSIAIYYAALLKYIMGEGDTTTTTGIFDPPSYLIFSIMQSLSLCPLSIIIQLYT